MPAYDSSYTGVQIDTAVGAVLTAQAAGGMISTNGLSTTLGNYLTSSDAASTYVPLKTTSDAGVFLRGDNTWSNILTGSIDISELFIHNDGSLQIFTQTNGQAYEGGNTENVCIQSCFDDQPYTYQYFSNNLNRCNLLLQPKGGQVYIGQDLTGLGDTAYKLIVNGNVNIKGKIWTDRNGYVPSTKQADSTNITDLINEVRYSQGQMGSVNISTSTHGVSTGWYNYLYIPHRAGIAGSDNHLYGTLLLFFMTTNASNFYMIHYTNGTINNAVTK